jgi:SPP1 gp7 family putative phage head morphogenesis protein
LTPIHQTHFEPHQRGNCAQAAVASFFNLPLKDVPNFIEQRDYEGSMRRFFRSHGRRLVHHKPSHELPQGYYLAIGPSPQGYEHMVVYRGGDLAHDPYPGGRGLLRVEDLVFAEPLPAADAKPKRLESAPVVLREIRPNLGVEAAYRRCLQDLLDRMTADLLRKLKSVYEPTAQQFALDDDPVVTLQRKIKLWRRQWVKRFDHMSDEIAQSFATRNQKNLEVAFRKRLKEAGFTVKFRPTERMTSAYRAVIAENVGLIRSIPQQYLKDVEGAVWRSAMRGGDLHALSQEIRQKHGVSARRAAFIATDQNAKARAVFEEARRAELGIEEAEWRHSGAGRKKRPTHVAMHGKRYDIKRGMWDSAVQRYIWPGMLPRCRCTSRSVLPGR